jgi:hypothetical protein
VLHQAIGPNYVKVLVQPGIGSLTREVMAQYTAEQVYSTARQEIQDKIRNLVEDRLTEKMMEREGEESYRVSMRDTIILYDILVAGIELPTAIVAAINRKTEQYYIAEEYKFRVEREKRESERKKIEGEGIRDFQQTVSQGISESYLRWRGIEATLQLSQSTNSKVVVIGSGKDGLPIILGNVDTPAPPSGGTPPSGNDTTNKERTIAASPTVPLEKTPAAGLATPTEKMRLPVRPLHLPLLRRCRARFGRSVSLISKPIFRRSFARGSGRQSLAQGRRPRDRSLSSRDSAVARNTVECWF